MANKVKKIDINDMNLLQLSQIKQQLEQEIEVLENSIQNLQNAKLKYSESKNSVERQSSVEKGSQVLVPLTGSMYVPAIATDNNRFIVDIGTGYYVSKNTKSTIDYFRRKVQFLSEQIDKYVKITQEKINARESILEVLQYKQQALIASQQTAGTSQVKKT